MIVVLDSNVGEHEWHLRVSSLDLLLKYNNSIGRVGTMGGLKIRI